MPTYVYQCNGCQQIFDVQATIKEKIAGLKPACPQCASDDARQLITAGLFIGSSEKASLGQSICGPGSGLGCCG
jgi:putative FmdB family regulatory protein